MPLLKIKTSLSCIINIMAVDVCPGDTSRQGIGSHGIYLVCPTQLTTDTTVTYQCLGVDCEYLASTDYFLV